MQRSLHDALLSVHDNVMNANDDDVGLPPSERPREIIAFDIFGQPVTTEWFPTHVARDSFGNCKAKVKCYFAPPTMIDDADTFYLTTYYPSETAFNMFANRIVGRKVKDQVLGQFTYSEDHRDYNLDLIMDGRHISEGLKQNSSGNQLNVFDTELTARAFGTEFGIEASMPLETVGESTSQNPYNNDQFGYYNIEFTINGDTVYQKQKQDSGEPNDHHMISLMFNRIRYGALMNHLDDLMVYE